MTTFFFNRERERKRNKPDPNVPYKAPHKIAVLNNKLRLHNNIFSKHTAGILACCFFHQHRCYMVHVCITTHFLMYAFLLFESEAVLLSRLILKGEIALYKLSYEVYVISAICHLHFQLLKLSDSWIF